MTPAYLHVVLNHFPIIGLMVGAALLATSLLRKSADLRAAALVVIAVSGLSAWPVAELGDEGIGSVQSYLDAPALAILHEHEERAEKAVPAALITAGLAVLALIASQKMPSLAPPSSLLCLASAMISLALIGWTAKAGGQIRHPEFRAPDNTCSVEKVNTP